MLNLCCPECGVAGVYQESSVCFDLEPVYVECQNCGAKILLVSENNIPKLNKYELPPLPESSLVKITNKEHPWYDEIGIIRERKFRHYRIEIYGQLIWMPEEWIIISGDNDEFDGFDQ